MNGFPRSANACSSTRLASTALKRSGWMEMTSETSGDRPAGIHATASWRRYRSGSPGGGTTRIGTLRPGQMNTQRAESPRVL